MENNGRSIRTGASLLRVLLRLIMLGAVAMGALVFRAPAQESETLFNNKCASCHAKDGSGQTTAATKLAVPDLRSKRIREMDDAKLTDSIGNGTAHRDYPHAFLHIGLTKDQIAGLVKHIRLLQSEKKPPEKK